MSNKTALSEIIHELKSMKSTSIYSTSDVMIGLDIAIEQCERKLEKEQKLIIDFGEKMQMIKDIDSDGDVVFCFVPETAFIQMFKTT